MYIEEVVLIDGRLGKYIALKLEGKLQRLVQASGQIWLESPGNPIVQEDLRTRPATILDPGMLLQTLEFVR